MTYSLQQRKAAKDGGAILAKVSRMALDMHNVAFNVFRGAPETLEDATAYYEANGFLGISGEHSQNTIFPEPKDNWAFRAWHDFHHVKSQYPFTTQGEQCVMFAQQRDARQLRLSGLISWDELGMVLDLIDCEVRGQAEYFEKMGKFPADQIGFTIDYLSL